MGPSLLSNGPSDALPALVLAHGAEASKTSLFMEAIAEGLSSRGWLIHRFSFPYIRRTRETGRQCSPDRSQVLQQCFRELVDQVAGDGPFFIGGKSIGGRIPSML